MAKNKGKRAQRSENEHEKPARFDDREAEQAETGSPAEHEHEERGGEALKLTDYYEPKVNFEGYGYGYGGV